MCMHVSMYTGCQHNLLTVCCITAPVNKTLPDKGSPKSVCSSFENYTRCYMNDPHRFIKD
jgi:hypothetical protein